jgi:tetratricopeptide (TPR) repeat protein
MIRDDLPFQPPPEFPPGALEPSGQEETLGALGLLDQLPAPGERETDDWLPESSLLALVETAEQLRLAQQEERKLAPELATQLERHPETRARLLIDNQPRFRTWGLAEELIGRSHKAIFEADSCRAVRIARLGVAVADRLEPLVYGAPLRADLRARCWGNLGNAYRCSGRLRAAASALERADQILLEGTGDPLEGALLLGYHASLATASGDFERSAALLEDACSIYEEIEETGLLARTLVKLCTPYGYLDSDKGALVAREAESLLDPERDSRLFLMARHNHIRCVIDAGNPEHAAMLLEASRKYYRREPNRWIQLNLGWTEARLSIALGRLREGEAAYEVLLHEMLELGYQLDGALVALDLAATRIALGKFEEAAELASAMGHNLHAWGAHAKARSAWAVLQHGLKVERATTEMVREVAVYLQRSWYNPEVPLPGQLARRLPRRGRS